MVKEKISCELPEEIEITFKNNKDNIREFEIMDYVIRSAGYSFEDIQPVDESKTMYIVYFKRKS